MIIRRSIGVVIIMLVLAVNSAYATNYNVLTDMGSSSKMIAIGNIEGFSDSAAGVLENPASLTNTKKTSVSLFTTTLMDDAIYTAGAVSVTVPFGKLGLGYMGVGVSGIPYGSLDQSNQVKLDGYASYKSEILKLSYQFNPRKNISVGASLIQYSSDFFDVHAKGYNVELGTLIDMQPFQLSIVGRNLMGNSVVLFTGGDANGTEKLATNLIVSGKYHWEEMDVLTQFKNIEDTTLFSYGVIYTPRFFTSIQLLGGFKNYRVLDTTKSGYTIGLNLRVKDVQFQYAYEKSDYYVYDSKNYFSVSAGF